MSAAADLDELYDYIARDVPYYAEQFVGRLIDAVGALKDYPRLGRRVPEAEEREDVARTRLPGLPRHLSRRCPSVVYPDRHPRQP